MACALLLPWATGASCASRAAKHPGRPPTEPTPTPATAETRVGVVRAVGADQRFVLIETASASASAALSDGQLLHCRPPESANRLATADLRVSRERHQTLVVANVVAGEPAVGATVYSVPEVTGAPASPPDAISTLATAPLPGLFPSPKP